MSVDLKMTVLENIPKDIIHLLDPSQPRARREGWNRSRERLVGSDVRSPSRVRVPSIDDLMVPRPRDISDWLESGRAIGADRFGRDAEFNPIELTQDWENVDARSSNDPGEMRDRLKAITTKEETVSAAEMHTPAWNGTLALPSFMFRLVDSAARKPNIGVATTLAAPPPVMPEPAGPSGSASWGITRIGAEGGRLDWGQGCKVAILDTGLARHVAFDGVHVTWKDFVNEEGTPQDQHDLIGHGTHCAGTILGRDVSIGGGKFQIGVARGVTQLLAGKILRQEDAGTSSDAVFGGLLWAVGEHADVISMSIELDFLGFHEYYLRHGAPPHYATSLTLEAYRQNLRLFDRISDLLGDLADPPIVVVASGNQSNRPEYSIACGPPANGDEFVSVAAIDIHDIVAPDSCANPKIAAPGIDIWSAGLNGGSSLVAKSGSSMAAPHVAGIAAVLHGLARASGQSTSPEDIVDEILRNVDPLVGGAKEDVGRGCAMVRHRNPTIA